MSYSPHTNLRQIRHVERGDSASIDSIIQSAARFTEQAGTSKNKAGHETKWLQPFVKPLTSIDPTSSSTFAFRVPPPTRKSLLLTLPPASTSHSLELLNWDAPITAHESTGLSGLEDFASDINWSVRRPPIVPSTTKRRLSTDEPGSAVKAISAKRICLPPASSVVPERKPAPAPSSLPQPHGLVIQRGMMARFRLGLRKRPAVDPQKPPGTSLDVKMTTKRQLGPGPPRILTTDGEPSEVLTTTSLPIPAQVVIRSLPQTPKDYSRKGIVLVPSSQSPDVVRSTKSFGLEDSWTHNRVVTSVLYDSSPEVSPDRTRCSWSPDHCSTLRGTVKVSKPQKSPVSNLGDKEPTLEGMPIDSFRELPSDEEGSSELSKKVNRMDECPTETHTEVSGSGFYPLQESNNHLMTSVMYDSSQGSTSSHSGDHSKLHTSYGSLALPSSFDDKFLSQNTDAPESWDLSQLPPTNSIPSSILVSRLTFTSPHFEQAHVTTGSIVIPGAQDIIGPPNPEEATAGLGIISVMYDSSQDDSVLARSRNLRALSRESPHEPVPSWSSYKSSQNSTFRPLSGARPSSSWSIPSVEGLVAASRSLSLEDFENQVRRPASNEPVTSDRQPRIEQSLSHSQLGHNLTDSIELATSLMHPEVSRLTSYLSTEDSIRSSTPSLPQPAKRIIDDDSIESINSLLPNQITHSAQTNKVPRFRLPRPELDDDISFESQQAHKPLQSTPTPSANPNSPLEMIDSSASDHRISVPRFDAPPTPGGRSPRAVASAVETAISPAQKPSNSVILSAPNHQTPLDHLSLRSTTPLILPSSKIYKGGLYRIIPQPHLLPSLSGSSSSLAEGMLAALEFSSVHTWFDEDGNPASPLEDFPRDPWKRAAWIIPVRGRPPWEGCSSAAISSRPIVKARKKRTILWTPAALRSMWAQLDGFRQSKRVGFLSLSFEPVRTDSQDQTFEFVKVYHDAKVSLKLRTILKVLEFPDRDGYGVDVETPQEDDDLGLAGSRRLLGSSTRLALVDEVGRIVLVS